MNLTGAVATGERVVDADASPSRGAAALGRLHACRGLCRIGPASRGTNRMSEKTRTFEVRVGRIEFKTEGQGTARDRNEGTHSNPHET